MTIGKNKRSRLISIGWGLLLAGIATLASGQARASGPVPMGFRAHADPVLVQGFAESRGACKRANDNGEVGHPRLPINVPSGTTGSISRAAPVENEQ